MASRGIDESTMLEPMDVANDVDEGWSFKSGPGLGTGDEVSTVTWPPIIALPPPPPPLSTSSCEGCRSGDIRFHTGIHWKISSIVIVVVLSGDCPNFPNCVTFFPFRFLFFLGCSSRCSAFQLSKYGRAEGTSLPVFPPAQRLPCLARFC